MVDICSIGHITRDKIVTPDKTVYMAGGTSFYMTYGISHLPRKVSYQLVTKVGEESQEDIEKIKKLGLDVVCYPSRHTVFFENIYGKDFNGRTQKVRAKADPFTIEDVKPLEAKVFQSRLAPCRRLCTRGRRISRIERHGVYRCARLSARGCG